MAGLTEFYCGSNEPIHASQFKWLEYTFKWLFSRMLDSHCGFPARTCQSPGTSRLGSRWPPWSSLFNVNMSFFQVWLFMLRGSAPARLVAWPAWPLRFPLRPSLSAAPQVLRLSAGERQSFHQLCPREAIAGISACREGLHILPHRRGVEQIWAAYCIRVQPILSPGQPKPDVASSFPVWGYN